jgi:TolB-like protein
VRLLAATLVVALATSAFAADPPKRTRIAVLDLGAFGIDETQRALLSEVALTAAGSSKRIQAIGKSDIAAMLGFEKQRQMVGCGEDFSCIAEIGGALGVDYILTGSVGTIGDLHRVDVKLVEVRKSNVAARAGESVSGGAAALVAAVQRAVRQALLPLDAELAPPPAEPFRLTARKKTALWLGGGGLACLAGAGVVGLLARSSYQGGKDASAVQDRAAYDVARSDLRVRNLTADSLLGAGVLFAGVGTWLWFTESRPSQVLPPVAVAPVHGGAMVLFSGRLP